MFTGIITDLGSVREVIGQGDVLFRIGTSYDVKTIEIGASIAHNGVCLTVIERGSDWYAIQASAETLTLTTMGAWKPGQRVNLERALKVGDELGGHIVSGHVDGIATLVEQRAENQSVRLTFEVPAPLAKFVAAKGSVALDGVSLTVNEVSGTRFGVNIIPHTQAVTSFGTYRPGDRVNLEIDMLARYVARLIEKDV
jgi:riboflavin synthase